jgi:hypothetical protein
MFQRYDPSTQSFRDKRRNQRNHLEDVEGIGKVALVSFQRVNIYEYSDADGGYDTDCQRGLARRTVHSNKGGRRTHCQDKYHDRHSQQFSTFITGFTAYDPSSPDDDAIRQDKLVFYVSSQCESEIVHQH